MLSDLWRGLVRWPLYNPRRLAAVVVGAVVLLVAAGQLSGHRAATETANAAKQLPAAAARPSAPTPEATSSASSPAPSAAVSVRPLSRPANGGAALRVARDFVAAWASHQPRRRWAAQTTAYATVAFGERLGTVDPSRVPATRVTGPPTVTQYGRFGEMVTVPTDGGSVAVTLVDQHGRWLVADVMPGSGR